MKATLLRTQEGVSKYGGKFYYAFFKGEDGRSYRSCLYPNCGNFMRWRGFIGKKDIVLDGLVKKGTTLIDADSFPRQIQAEPKDTEQEAMIREGNHKIEEQLNLNPV